MSDAAETILIVEDDPGIAALQQRVLSRAGFNVESIDDPGAAQKRIERGGIDLLLLDNRLAGGFEGLTLHHHLKDAGYDIPVILVTGFSDDSTVIRALRAGVVDYVTKSDEYLDYLPDAVRRALDQVKTRRQLRRVNEELRTALNDLQAKTEELRTTTQQLWQSAKLASVGELAAGIAHELNNPLGTISLRLESLLAKTPTDDPRHKSLEIVEQEVERMATLVANLLQFSRRGKDESSTFDVIEELQRTLELMQHHLRRREVTVRLEFGDQPILIHADRQKLRQVFLNLVTNAIDAMSSGGTLTLDVRWDTKETGKPSAIVEVNDTGHGIPSELLPKVMDPFFTTKDEGKGTGLGLAICRRIVQEHQGSIQIESEPGKGTTVRLILPGTSAVNTKALQGDA